MEPSCQGQLHGHNFPYAGAKCLACGVGQNELSGVAPVKPLAILGNPFARVAPPKRVPIRGIHTELQALVSETRAQFGETATRGKGSFGFYMGFFKRLGIERVRLFLGEAKEKDNPKKFFWWRVGQYYKDKKAQKNTS